MTSRERVLTSLNKKEPDRIPLFYRDVPEVEKRLLRDLDLPGRVLGNRFKSPGEDGRSGHS
jgi:hypothetical protein